MWGKEKVQIISEFLRSYNNNDVVPVFEALQKISAFYHNKGIEKLKLAYTLVNLANIFLQKYTNAKLYLLTESDEDLREKIREDMVVGPSIVFTQKVVVNEDFFHNSSKIFKSIVGTDASHIYTYSMCQPMLTGFCTRNVSDQDLQRFEHKQKKLETLKIWSCLILYDPEQKLK